MSSLKQCTSNKKFETRQILDKAISAKLFRKHLFASTQNLQLALDTGERRVIMPVTMLRTSTAGLGSCRCTYSLQIRAQAFDRCAEFREVTVSRKARARVTVGGLCITDCR